MPTRSACQAAGIGLQLVADRLPGFCRIRTDHPSRPRLANMRGFTLVELAVVVLLISITLVFALPRLPELPSIDPAGSAARWIIVNVRDLKERAVREQKRYTLHVGIDRSRFWITHEAMTDEERQAAENDSYRLPGGVRVAEVAYPDATRQLSGQADIAFHQKGYSDRVILHLADGQDKMSFQIEPFLSRVKVYDRHVGFEG